MSELELFDIFCKNDAKQHFRVSLEHCYSDIKVLLGVESLDEDQLRELRRVHSGYDRMKKKRLSYERILEGASTKVLLKRR